MKRMRGLYAPTSPALTVDVLEAGRSAPLPEPGRRSGRLRTKSMLAETILQDLALRAE